jgi:hypothetical protein
MTPAVHHYTEVDHDPDPWESLLLYLQLELCFALLNAFTDL